MRSSFHHVLLRLLRRCLSCRSGNAASVSGLQRLDTPPQILPIVNLTASAVALGQAVGGSATTFSITGVASLSISAGGVSQPDQIAIAFEYISEMMNTGTAGNFDLGGFHLLTNETFRAFQEFLDPANPDSNTNVPTPLAIVISGSL